MQPIGGKHIVAWGQATFRRGGSVTPRLWPIFAVVVLWADVPFQEPAQGPSHGSSSCRKDPTPTERQKIESEKNPQVVVFLGEKRPGELVEILTPRSSPPMF